MARSGVCVWRKGGRVEENEGVCRQLVVVSSSGHTHVRTADESGLEVSYVSRALRRPRFPAPCSARF